MANSDLVRYHVQNAIRAAIAETSGWKRQAERLRAQGNLRLMVMSDEELWELAKVLSHPPARSIETAYEELKQVIEERKRTADEWMSALAVDPTEHISTN